MTRVPLISDDDADPIVRGVFDAVRASGREVPDLYRALANAPRVLEHWVDFASGIRADSSVERSVRELAIMRVAFLGDVDYEWRHHWKMGRAAGLTEEQLRAIPRWSDRSCFAATERAVLRAADELVDEATLTTPTWGELRALWSSDQVIEIVLTISFYICISRMLGALDLALEDRYQQVPSIVDVLSADQQGE